MSIETNKQPLAIENAGSFLPQLTNRWLKVNSVPTDAESYPAVPAGKPFGGVTIDGVAASEANASPVKRTGESGDLPEALDEAAAERLARSGYGISAELLDRNAAEANFTAALDLHEGDVRTIHFGLSAADAVLEDRIALHAKEGHQATVVLDLESLDDAPAHRNGTLVVDVEEDASLTLVLLQRMNAASVSNLSLVMQVADGGSLKIAHVELGGARSNYYLGGDLAGDESAFEEYAAYLTQNEASLDLYYNVRFHGKFSRGDIHVDGAMFDRSRKSFRGTLDFLEGAFGAVGDEEEFAMLMSDDVRSVAVPLLLCHEDAVQGNHATSAGRMDEEMLFYLMSRGLSRRDAEGLIVESRMVPTLDRIPDEALRQTVREAVHARIVRRDV